MKKAMLFLLLLFFIVFPKSAVFADEGSPSATATPTATAAQYDMPYPGILPDNPLYFLKTLRDQLIVLFISDPLRKSQYYLLQSDKRLESAWYLQKKGAREQALALTTLSKSTNYLSMAIDQLSMAKANGEDINGQAAKLTNAVSAHIAVAKRMGADVAHEEIRLEDLAKVVSQFSVK